MKWSLVCTLVIIALTSVFGWWNHKRLEGAERRWRELTQKAEKAGISADVESSPRSVRRVRNVSGSFEPGTVAAELLTFLETCGENGAEDLDVLERQEQRLFDWRFRLSELDADELEALLAEIRSITSTDEEFRNDAIQLLMDALAAGHPRRALDHLSRDLHTGSVDGYGITGVAAEALIRLIERAPDAGIAWYLEHEDGLPSSGYGTVADRLIRGTATIDPDLAFDLIERLGVNDEEYAVSALANSARNGRDRSAILAALREFTGEIADPERGRSLRNEGIGSLLMTAFMDDVEEGLAWIERSDLSQQELEDYATRHYFNFTAAEQRRWIEWLAEHVSTRKVASHTVSQTVFQMSRSDPRAVEKWLGEDLPEGRIRTTAIETFANTLARHDPATARRWAQKLPEGSRRSEVIERIEDSEPTH